MKANDKGLRTRECQFLWRWWDEAEHKRTSEERLAFYDAIMAYVFLGKVPPDPLCMEAPTGVDYAAYDATHYFDIIDYMLANGNGKNPSRTQAEPKPNPSQRGARK